MNRRPNGDIDRGIFAGRITTAAGGGVTMEGTWQFSGGTGALSSLSGGGTYKDLVTSPTELDVSWEGTYQLGRSDGGLQRRTLMRAVGAGSMKHR
jgi:hypothetical protein